MTTGSDCSNVDNTAKMKSLVIIYIITGKSYNMVSVQNIIIVIVT